MAMYYAKFTLGPILYAIIPLQLSNEFMKKFPFTEIDIIHLRRKLSPKINPLRKWNICKIKFLSGNNVSVGIQLTFPAYFSQTSEGYLIK